MTIYVHQQNDPLFSLCCVEELMLSWLYVYCSKSIMSLIVHTSTSRQLLTLWTTVLCGKLCVDEASQTSYWI